MHQKPKIHLNYKVVPFTFDINFSDTKELLDSISKVEDFEFQTSTESPFIWKIETYHYDAKEEKIFISIRWNYKNNKDKKIIDNDKKQFDGKIGSNKTLTNEYIFVFDFWSCLDWEIFTTKDTSIKKWFLFAYYEWSYHVVRTLTHYFEQELFDKIILNIGNFTTKDKPLSEVKDFLSKIETDVVMSNGDWKQRTIWSFHLSPKKLFYTTEKNSKVEGSEYNVRFVLDTLEEIKRTLNDFSAWIKKVFPTVSYELTTSVRIKQKKRPFIQNEEMGSYVIKSFPDEEKLSEEWQKLVHDILQKQLSEAENRTILTEEWKKLVERIFWWVNLFKINKSRKVED
jgi:hypothetical protein